MRYMRIALWCVAVVCIHSSAGNAFGGPGCVQPPNLSCCYDFWTTPSSGTSADLSSDPIPAGCFTSLSGADSEAFGGTISLKGLPFGPNSDPHKPADADTVVWRERDPTTCGCGPAVDVIPVRIYALSLESTSPVTIDYDSGPSEPWDVTVSLSCLSDQPEGTLTAHRLGCNDGWFSTIFEVYPLYTFTRVGDGAGSPVIIDSADRTHGTGSFVLQAASVTFDCNGPAGGGGGGGFTPGGGTHTHPGGVHVVDPCWACFPDPPNPCAGVLITGSPQFTTEPNFSAVRKCNQFITAEFLKHLNIAAKK